MSTTPGATPPPLPSPIPPRQRTPEQRDGCASAFMVVVGIILLLPGLCALIVTGASLSDRRFPSDLMSLIMFGLLTGFAGVMLIRAATRGPRS